MWNVKTRNCPLDTHFIFAICVKRVRVRILCGLRCNEILHSYGWMDDSTRVRLQPRALFNGQFLYTSLQYTQQAKKRRNMWQMCAEPLIFFSSNARANAVCTMCCVRYVRTRPQPTHTYLLTHINKRRRKKRGARDMLYNECMTRAKC